MNNPNPEQPYAQPPETCSGGKPSRGLALMNSLIDGVGCFATLPFPKGEPIAEYTGERINEQEAMRRMKKQGRARITELAEDCYIDGSVGGNQTQYINHSCEPNADALAIDGLLVIFSIRDISAGEEITISYLNSFEEDKAICRCRSASCKERVKQMDHRETVTSS